MSKAWILSLLVGCGGFVGSMARYGASLASQRFSIEWPIGTLSANMLGCLSIGIVVALSARSDALSPEIRLALATGFCGGFTTMSSFIYETAEMLRTSEVFNAAVYVAGTFLLSMLAYLTGLMSIKILFKMGGWLWN